MTSTTHSNDSIEITPPGAFARMASLMRTGPRALFLRFYDQITRIITGAPVQHLSEITPQLYLGGQHRRRGWPKMQKMGFTTIVNMRESWHDDTAQGISGDYHLHLVTQDNTPPMLAQLQEGVVFIQAAVERGDKVYVHCGVGVGRAPIMAAAYLVSTGLTPDEALRKIRAIRPFVHPTSTQRARLVDFAEYLAQQTP